MAILSTRMHGVLDYVVGGFLMVSPWVLGFKNKSKPATYLPIALGAGALVYSLLTDYELGVSDKISMPTHLKMDAANGALLAASPWLFGFARRGLWKPHLLLGLFELAAVLMTNPKPRK